MMFGHGREEPKTYDIFHRCRQCGESFVTRHLMFVAPNMDDPSIRHYRHECAEGRVGFSDVMGYSKVEEGE